VDISNVVSSELELEPLVNVGFPFPYSFVLLYNTFFIYYMIYTK
jgi:hypothetical protein